MSINMLKKNEGKLLLGLKEILVPISRFNKGECSRILDEVKEFGTKIICKNNVPECALVEYNQYESLLQDAQEISILREKIIDMELRILAYERLNDPNLSYVSWEKVKSTDNIAYSDLEGIEIEFE